MMRFVKLTVTFSILVAGTAFAQTNEQKLIAHTEEFRKEIIQVTDEGFAPAAFNDWGEMTSLCASAPVTNICYMRRIRTGEADFDGHIDLKDAAAFQNCYTGEGDFDGTVGGFDRLCDCRFLDIDHDRDVDADDYALFATAMTGPE